MVLDVRGEYFQTVLDGVLPAERTKIANRKRNGFSSQGSNRKAILQKERDFRSECAESNRNH